jgi:hypothetical protein
LARQRFRVPVFVDAAAGDFHLAAGSPGIGSADFGMDMGAFVQRRVGQSRAERAFHATHRRADRWRSGNLRLQIPTRRRSWSAAVPFTAVAFPRDGTPVKRTTTLTFNNLADGLHVLEVIGQDFAASGRRRRRRRFGPLR